MNIEIQKEIQKVRIVDTNRNYWFIRTYGGEMYKDFIRRNYIGIGMNEVPFEYIEKCKDKKNTSYNNLRNYVEKNTSYKDGQATNWTNQLIAFQHIASVGDLVIIPNKNSTHFSIGTIESNIHLVKEKNTFYHQEKYVKFPEKRRTVKWEKIIGYSDVKNDLRGMTSTHQAISNINNYSDRIEGHITNIYIKKNEMHLVVRIDQDEEINAFDLNDFLSSITYFYKEFCEEEGIEFNRNLTIKIKLQSKGTLALKAIALGGLLGVAGLIALSGHSEFKTEIKGRGKMEFKSGDGFLHSLSDFLDRKQEREIQFIKFRDSVKNLKANGLKDSVLDNNSSNSVVEKRKSNDRNKNRNKN